MKLIFCKKCSDVFKLQYEYRSCLCGNTRGKYINNINAITEGTDYEVLGFNNSSLKEACNTIASERLAEVKRDWGLRFEAFIIPDGAPSVWKKINTSRIYTTNNLNSNRTMEQLKEILSKCTPAERVAMYNSNKEKTVIKKIIEANWPEDFV